jgi:hypothetical protein
MGTLMESIAGASCYRGTINAICLVRSVNGTCSSCPRRKTGRGWLLLVDGMTGRARQGDGTGAVGPAASPEPGTRGHGGGRGGARGGIAWPQLASSRSRHTVDITFVFTPCTIFFQRIHYFICFLVADALAWKREVF